MSAALKHITYCPLCRGPKRKKIISVTQAKGLIKGNFTIYQCKNCGLGYTSPRPSDRTLEKLYDDSFYAESKRLHIIASNILQLFLRRRRKRIEKYLKPGRLLDYGCGSGQFVNYMADNGWEAFGFDFSLTAQFLNKNNEKGTFFSQKNEIKNLPEASFDCITLWQVLEHIPEPFALLKRLKKLLKPGGILVVSVPNIDSIQAKITGSRWWGLDVPRHLIHFSPKSLRKMLKEAGYQIKRTKALSFRYSPYAFFHSLLDFIFTHRHFLSDLYKRRLPPDIKWHQIIYNIIALIILTPLLIPVVLAITLISSCFLRGGFIEVMASRED